MEEMQISPLVFFGLLETLIVLLIVAVVFIVRNKILGGRIKGLETALRKAEDVEVPEAAGYAQLLRDEVVRNQALVDQAGAAEDEAEKQAGELLLMRKRFLELELEAHELEGNPVAFQERMVAGMTELIDQLRPEPETVVETGEQAADEDAEGDSEGEDSAEEESRKTLDTHDAEFDRLKQVINNQQDAMEALRAELKARESEIEDLDTILAKLDEFEAHDSELQNCLAVLEQENQRLKQAHGEEGGDTPIEPMDPAQLTGLKSMIGNQQETIQNLQSLLQELAPEASKAKELEQAITSIEQANMELNSCVAVLEDENAMLRAELEAINAQLEQQEQAAAAVEEIDIAEADEEPDLTVEDPDSGAGDEEERRQLEIKVQELEALVEFKDAAIEELEKQYSSLESKYLAISAEKDAS